MRSPLLRSLVADPRHGPLPALLLLLSLTTGMADAVTILRLDKVFTANMTGNTVFLGLSAAGAPGFPLAALATALLSFVAGAWAGGEISARSRDRASLLRNTTAGQAAFVVAAALIAPRIPALALLALSFGMQNAAVNRLDVPDITTSVLTRTLTALVVDARRVPLPATLRRLLAVLCILAGAALGAVLVLHTSIRLTLGVVV